MPKRSTGVDGENKRFPLNMRTTKEMRERLQAAASESGRSLVQEVESRLERSFDADRHNDFAGWVWGSKQTEMAVHLLSVTIKALEAVMGARWYENADVRAAVYEAVPRVFNNTLELFGEGTTPREKLISALMNDKVRGETMADLISSTLGVGPLANEKQRTVVETTGPYASPGMSVIYDKALPDDAKWTVKHFRLKEPTKRAPKRAVRNRHAARDHDAG